MTSLDSNPKKPSESVAPIKKVEICTQQHFVSLAYDRLVDLLAREERGSGQLVPSDLISLVEEYSKADVYLPVLRKIFETFLLIRDAINEYAEETLSGTDSSAVGIAAKLFCGAYLRSVYCFELDENVLWELLLGILEPSERASIEPVENVLRVKAFSIYRQGLHRLIDCLPSPYGGRRGEGAKSRVSFETFTRNILDKASKKRLYGPDDLACLIPLLDERMYFAFVCAPEGCWDRNPKHVSIAVPGNDRKLIIQKIWEAYSAREVPLSQAERVAKLYAIHLIFFDEPQDDEAERVTELARALEIDQGMLDQMLAQRKIIPEYMKIFANGLMSGREKRTLWALTSIAHVNSHQRKMHQENAVNIIPEHFRVRHSDDPNMCYIKLDKRLGSWGPSLRHYSILLKGVITEEIFAEPIDLNSFTFLCSLVEGSLGESVLPSMRHMKHSAEIFQPNLMAHLMENCSKRDDKVYVMIFWLQNVFDSPVPSTETAKTFSACFAILRQKGITLSKPSPSVFHLQWAVHDEELALFLEPERLVNQPDSLKKIQAVADSETRLELTQIYSRLKFSLIVRQTLNAWILRRV